MSRILLVDDDISVRESFEMLLRLSGHKVTAVESAVLAQVLIEQGEKFELVISDYQMPGMNGMEFLEKFRADPDNLPIPFILMSGMDNIGPLEKACAKHDGVYFFSKLGLSVDKVVSLVLEKEKKRVGGQCSPR